MNDNLKIAESNFIQEINSSELIKECPHCNKQAEVFVSTPIRYTQTAYVICKSCGATVSVSWQNNVGFVGKESLNTFGRTREIAQAIDLWNTREAVAPQHSYIRVEGIKRKYV